MATPQEKAANKAALLALLRTRSDTAERLGNMIGVSYRSVYRYVQEMRCEGLRIDGSTGSGGGLMLRPRRRVSE
jgi:predicted DNA-binding transcriptional regulator YafY